jgi:hypothetical protein
MSSNFVRCEARSLHGTQRPADESGRGANCETLRKHSEEKSASGDVKKFHRFLSVTSVKVARGRAQKLSVFFFLNADYKHPIDICIDIHTSMGSGPDFFVGKPMREKLFLIKRHLSSNNKGSLYYL